MDTTVSLGRRAKYHATCFSELAQDCMSATSIQLKVPGKQLHKMIKWATDSKKQVTWASHLVDGALPTGTLRRTAEGRRPETTKSSRKIPLCCTRRTTLTVTVTAISRFSTAPTGPAGGGHWTHELSALITLRQTPVWGMWHFLMNQCDFILRPGLELTLWTRLSSDSEIRLSASLVLGLKACATKPGQGLLFVLWLP